MKKFHPHPPYFVFNPSDSEIYFFQTAEEQGKFVAKLMDSYRHADGAWSEEVDKIITGLVTHRIQPVGDCDDLDYCERKLLPVDRRRRGKLGDRM